jgi:hypothetical protein
VIRAPAVRPLFRSVHSLAKRRRQDVEEARTGVCPVPGIRSAASPLTTSTMLVPRPSTV